MTENKDVKQGSVLSSFPLLAAANLLFVCLEFILAIEARSASLFSDSIAFLEGASVSVLMSSGRNWSMPGREAFARVSRTIILIPTGFLFWMIAANYYGAVIPSAAPLAVIVLAAFLTWASGTMWPDVLAGLGILSANASAAEHICLAARESPLFDA